MRSKDLLAYLSRFSCGSLACKAAILGSAVFGTVAVRIWLEASALTRSISRAESAVVLVSDPAKRPRLAYFRLSGNSAHRFLAEVQKDSLWAGSREYPTAFYMRVYLLDNRDRCYAEIYVQPAATAIGARQIGALITAASDGVPVQGENRFDAGWQMYRKCVE